MEGQKQENLQNNIENEGLNTHQYCFANISATKAPIFMKFETSINKIVKIVKINAHLRAQEA